MTEVRVTHLHPRELRERRAQLAVAWLPLGTIEWHGRHLPLGFDGVKAEALCIKAASEIGGVVFPPQYYADHRGVILESLYAPGVFTFPPTFDHRVEVCAELGVSVEGVTANARRDHDRAGGRAHVDILERTYWMIRAYGFTRVVAVAGHYPNVSPAAVAAERFHAAQSSCRVISGTEADLGTPGGDHAGAYETAQLAYLLPGLVHLDRLDGDRGDEPLGIMGEHPALGTAERGREIVDAFVRGCRERLGAVPPPAPIADPDEDGVGGDWAQVLRDTGLDGLRSMWR